MNTNLIIALSVVSLPVYAFWARLIFGGAGSFVDSILQLFISDFVRAFSPTRVDDEFSLVQLYLWVAICALSIASEYHLVQIYLPGVFAFFQ